jgi:hypothetical protein
LFAVLAFSVSLSGIAIAWSWSHGALLNYGDAAAHLHIARRVFDSHQPRFSELGSVWLPLPHILLLPLVQKYNWWASGTAGILPSALAYIAACLGIYRLARRWIPPIPAALALVFFATNPNLLYLDDLLAGGVAFRPRSRSSSGPPPSLAYRLCPGCRGVHAL